MSYEKTTWAAGDKVTSAKLNNIENGIEAVESAATALNEQVQQNANVINDNAGILDDTINDVEYLLSKIYVLENKLEDMRKTNVVPRSVGLTEFPETTSTAVMDNKLTLDQTSDDVVITVDEPMVGKCLEVNAKSVTAKDMQIESGKFTVTCPSGDVTFNGFETSGELVRTSAGPLNKAFDIDTNEYVTIKNCTFGMKAYNTLEIGLDNTAPKNVIIDNCVFEKNTNNSILVFALAENGQITISNCHFKACSNVLRYSNRANTKGVVINFINCQFDELEARSNMLQWKAVFICEDYSSQATNWVENNLFAPEKFTVNFVNCTYEGQPIEVKENQEDYWNYGSAPAEGQQLLGVVCYDNFAHESFTSDGIPTTYNAERLPVINVR